MIATYFALGLATGKSVLYTWEIFQLKLLIKILDKKRPNKENQTRPFEIMQQQFRESSFQGNLKETNVTD